MKTKTLKVISAIMAGTLALSLTGCSQDPTETAFDATAPWHDATDIAPNGSYEKLEYSVKIYDTSGGVADNVRKTIADGTLTYDLIEDKAANTTTVDMAFAVTFNSAAPEADRGLTDAITSRVTFMTESLMTRSMKKTVKLARRANVADLSYIVEADYFDTQKATYRKSETDEPRTMSLPGDPCRDNEMMFYLARAQKLGESSENLFFMTNIFDSFTLGKFQKYTMTSQSVGKRTLDMNEFVKDFGVEMSKNEETGEITYPVSCYRVNIAIYDERQGPAYIVHYSENPFVSGDKSHGKIPLRIEYNTYKNSNPDRTIEYTLTGCSFDKPAV